MLKADGGVFSKFTWLADPYDSEMNQKSQLRVYNKSRQDELHKDCPFNPGNIKKQMKYEYPFLARNEITTRKFLRAEDPYMLTAAEKLRSRWIEESKILFGDFCPSGPQKPIQTISKSKLKDIVDYLKKMLLNDWNDVNFVIGTNPNDLIEIKFDVQSTDTAHGLNAYMNTLMNSNEIINGFNLRKVTQYWPYQEGPYIYYMIAPPWKKLYVVSAQFKNDSPCT